MTTNGARITGRCHRRACLWLAVLLGCSMLPSLASGEKACDEALLQRVQSAYQAISSFKGRFHQEDHRTDGEVLSAQGSIAYLRPGRMRWEYDPPNEQLLVTDGKTVWLFDPLLDNVTVESLQAVARGTPLSFLLGLGNLSQDFTCRSLSRPPPEDGLTYLELVPRKKIPTLEFIQLGVDGKTAQLSMLIMVDTPGNARLVRLKNLKLGVPFKPEAFTFKITPDMEVIRR